VSEAVWKYPFLDWSEKFSMPAEARVVHVDVQHGAAAQEVICLWALVDPEKAQEERRFEIYASGQAADPDSVYVGTAIRRSGTVWHVFEMAQ
jgi:hypothetical protein